jgi:glucokinase
LRAGLGKAETIVVRNDYIGVDAENGHTHLQSFLENGRNFLKKGIDNHDFL